MKQPLAIAHLTYALMEGEFFNFLAALHAQFLQKGLSSYIINIVEKDGVKRDLPAGIEILTFEKANEPDLKLAWRLAQFFSNRKPALVHSYDKSLVWGTLAAKLKGISCVHSHYHDERALPDIWEKLNKFVIFPSEYNRQKVGGQNPHQKFKVIPHGVDTGLYNRLYSLQEKSFFRKELGLKPDSILIGNMGPLVPEEDQATLIKAFRKMLQKKLNAELIFTGEGPLLEDLKKVASHYEVNEQTKFLGHRLQKLEFLHLFEVLVDCSFKVKSPLLLLEAMASGIPVVATKIGANPEVVVEKETGYLVPCGFPERIDSALMRLNAIEGLSADMGQKAQKHVEQNYNIKKIAEDYVGLYKEALR